MEPPSSGIARWCCWEVQRKFSRVILNKALRHELTAVNQYWLHYRLLDNWGYEDLAKQWRKESIEEMEHADKLVVRIIGRSEHIRQWLGCGC